EGGRLATLHLLAQVVEGEEAEVEEGGAHGRAVDPQMLLRQMPAPGADEEGRQRIAQPVLLAAVRGAEGQGAADRAHERALTFDDGLPGGREGVLEVRHEDVRAGV